MLQLFIEIDTEGAFYLFLIFLFMIFNYDSMDDRGGKKRKNRWR